jgi:hypothetical protein
MSQEGSGDESEQEHCRNSDTETKTKSAERKKGIRQANNAALAAERLVPHKLYKVSEHEVSPAP